MTKIIKNIECLINGVSNSFVSRFETNIPEIKRLKENLYSNRNMGGFAEDKRNLQSDAANLSLDLQKSIFNIKKSL